MGFLSPDPPKIPKPKPAPKPKPEPKEKGKKPPKETKEPISDPNRAEAMDRARKRARAAKTRTGKKKFRKDLSKPMGTRATRGGIKIFKPRQRGSIQIGGNKKE